MKKTLTRIMLLAICLFVIAPVNVHAEAGSAAAPLSLATILLILVAVCIVCLGVYSLIKWKAKARFQEKMDNFFETISADSRDAAFGGGKKELYFVGYMLNELFPKGDLKDLFAKYVNVHETYTAFAGDVYKTFNYSKDSLKEFKEEDIYSLLSLVMLNVDGVKKFDDYSVERVEPFRRNAKEIIKCVETVASKDNAFRLNSEEPLGSKENPIVVAGPFGLKEYFDSVIAEDGTAIKYVHKSIMYVRDKELGIEYDLKKYSLRDANTDVEICSLWFNNYGHKNCEQCVAGFAFKENMSQEYLDLLQSDDDVCGLAAPTNVTASNISSSGMPKITWSEVEGANKYFVYKSMSEDGDYTYQGSTDDTSYVTPNAEAGVCYYYKVKAADTVNRFVKSQDSKVCAATCALKQPTAKVEIKSEKPFVSWGAVPGASKYDLYRSVGEDGKYEKLCTTNTTSVINVSAAAGKTYSYKVMAICAAGSAGNSAYSEEVSITI